MLSHQSRLRQLALALEALARGRAPLLPPRLPHLPLLRHKRMARQLSLLLRLLLRLLPPRSQHKPKIFVTPTPAAT